MRQYRGLWAGASLLLVLVGCSNSNKKINNPGVYSPIITGISVDHAPAIRGIQNHVTVLVTNVNGLPITYHWSAASGAITDTTVATAAWTPPDSVGTYDLTVSIQAQDGDAKFFKTQTYHVYVDNEYERWTRSDAIQFDPAPVPGGGVLYAEIRDNATGASDAYRVDAPGGGPAQLTSGFFTVTSPTPRADKSQFAFRGVPGAANSVAGIYLLPWAGGDAASASLATRVNQFQKITDTPRFARSGTMLLYASDSISSSTTGLGQRVIYRDAANFASAPVQLLDPNVLLTDGLFSANWGPDVNADGFPDSVVARDVSFPGFAFEQALGLVKLTTGVQNTNPVVWLADSSAAEPDWSPDGQHVVFTRRNPVSGDRDVWIINAASSDTSTAVRVTSGPADDSHPRFSADGTSIIFVSNRADNYGVSGIYPTERRGTNIWSVERFDKP